MLGLERTVSPAAIPLGGMASPAIATPLCREADGSLDVERTVARACACPPDVPAACRVDVCPRCGAPVLNEIAPAAVARPGADTGEIAPMPTTRYTLAQDALDLAELNHGERVVPVACRCGNDLEGRMLLVRDRDEIDREPYDTVVADRGMGDGPTVFDCDGCGAKLAADIVVLRDRHGRCAEQIAELAQVA